jgi:transcriptional regulator with GAF, ATPase, and Fis domain
MLKVKPTPETRDALAELGRQGDPEIGIQLLAMGERVKRIVPECVGLSLALLAENVTFTLVASDLEIASLDSVQYLDGGPCVDAAHQAESVSVDHDDVLAEDRWRMYAEASAAAGVASSLTLLIEKGSRVVGTVNLYARTADAFDGHHEALGVVLDASAEHVVANADLSFSTRLEAANAPTVLADQDDVDIALGIIAASQGVGIATAQERLRDAAARAGITEGQAARAIRPVLHPK